MPVIDTFNILFASNAKDVKKDMGEAQKSTKDFQEQVNQADKQTDQLGDRLLSLGVKAFIGFATFERLKDGVQNSIEFNTQLAKTQELTGEASDELSAWDAAFAKLSGNRGEFLKWYQDLAKYFREHNMSQNLPNAIPNILQFSDQIKKAWDSGNQSGARNLFGQLQQQYMLPDSFFQTIRQGSSSLREMQQEEKGFIDTTQKGNDAAREFSKEWQQTTLEVEGFFTQLGDIILPIFTSILHFFNTPIKIPNWLEKILNSNALTRLLLTPLNEDQKSSTKLSESSAISAPDFDLKPVSKKLPANTSGGIMIDGPAPKETTENGIGYGALLKESQRAIGTADSHPLNAGDTSTSSSRTVHVSGPITINTQATDANGIAGSLAAAINEQLNLHTNYAISANDSLIKY